MDNFLKIISSINDETRLRVLRFIIENHEVCVCDIENSFDMNQSRISRHLKILKEAKFLKVERRGRWAYYTVHNSLDEFRKNILKEIRCLKLEIPTIIKNCKVGN